MRQYTVLVEWDPEASAYSVVVPALPGCTSQGDTLDDALKNAREAIAGHIVTLRDLGMPIPEDRAPQAIRVEVAA
jgi:antitoxin HicB